MKNDRVFQVQKLYDEAQGRVETLKARLSELETAKATAINKGESIASTVAEAVRLESAMNVAVAEVRAWYAALADAKRAQADAVAAERRKRFSTEYAAVQTKLATLTEELEVKLGELSRLYAEGNTLDARGQAIQKELGATPTNLWRPGEVEAAFNERLRSSFKDYKHALGTRQPWSMEQLSFAAGAPDASAWNLEKPLT